MRLKRTRFIACLCVLLVVALGTVLSSAIDAANPAESPALSAPRLTNNPSRDVIVTNTRPLLSFFNATGGIGERTYTIQIDEVPAFDSESLLEYPDIPEETEYVTGKLVEPYDALQDKTRYYWRARATDSAGNQGPWDQSRFYLDTEADDEFMGMVRVPVREVIVSGGGNPKNIVDLDDPGQVTFWQSTPPGEPVQWVQFDLGKTWEVTRVWMLSNPCGQEGWLKSFVWKASDDGRTWTTIEGTAIDDNDTYRNIIDFEAVKARFLALIIKDWHGYAPQLNVVSLYSPGTPPVPEVPAGDYVLLVGNQMDGSTFTKLAQFIEDQGLGLATLTVPHYEVSMAMVRNLDRPPVAIVLSGNNADYPNLPMFEYNGEYEIIRESTIPLLGICAGHQQLAMAHGYTYARSMGWEDVSGLQHSPRRTEITIKENSPIFEGMANPFVSVEINSWAIAHLPGDLEVIAASGYVQAVRSRSRPIYGEQFHAEIQVPYNQGAPYLINFLKMAKEMAGG